MKRVIGLKEEIEIIGKRRVKTIAKFDTGAKSTSVDMRLAAKAMLGPIVRTIKIISASRKTGQRRIIVKATLKIAGKKIKAEVNVANRSHSKQKVYRRQNQREGQLDYCVRSDRCLVGKNISRPRQKGAD